jgi:hypothetical protein
MIILLSIRSFWASDGVVLYAFPLTIASYSSPYSIVYGSMYVGRMTCSEKAPFSKFFWIVSLMGRPLTKGLSGHVNRNVLIRP